MSLSKFAFNVTKFLARPVLGNPIQSKEELSQFLTLEYDLLIRSGTQLFGNTPILSGNTALMQQSLNGAFNKNLASTSTPSSILDDLGQGIISYWTGAQLVPGPPPIIPAQGSIYNISSTSGLVTDPGQWKVVPLPPFPPNGTEPKPPASEAPQLSSEQRQQILQSSAKVQQVSNQTQSNQSSDNPFVVNLLGGIVLHLTTVKGIYNTLSAYPAAPPVPPPILPGIVNWSTYTVLP
jgi:hypothetical protein